MKVRATAVAEGRANAIGTVELECTPHGLAVAYLGVGSFQQDYAPAALTMGTLVTVPWSKVEAARVEGDQMFLGIDPELTWMPRRPTTCWRASSLRWESCSSTQLQIRKVLQRQRSRWMPRQPRVGQWRRQWRAAWRRHLRWSAPAIMQAGS